MENDIIPSQPHDAYFKAIFSDPAHARALFQAHLPREVVALIDWSTLTPEPGSFVRHDLRQSHSDLLFSTTAAGHRALIYLLLEHQTTVDLLMPLRLFGYIFSITNQYAEQHGEPLPWVIPFVIHQGPAPWTAPTQFEQLLDGFADAHPLLPYVPKFSHVLLDLTKLDPASQERDEVLRVVLYLMKMARENRLVEFLNWLAETLAWEFSRNILRASLAYAFAVEDDLDQTQLESIFQKRADIKEEAMTFAEKLYAAGVATGEVRGEARGEARGTLVGAIQVLQDMMGLAPLDPDEVRRLSETDLKRRLDSLRSRFDLEHGA